MTRAVRIANLNDNFDPADIQVEKAKIIYPDMLAEILKNSNVTLVTGGKLLEDENLADLTAELVKRTGIKVFATGGSSKALIERGINRKEIKVVSLHVLTQYLEDLANKAQIQTLIFLGFEPYFLSRMLSSLRHFTKLVTISIDTVYQPFARLSFPNAFDSRFIETLVSLC